MSILVQQAVAKTLFDKLYSISPRIRVMGGAARDWYFNKEASDIDFYIEGKTSLKDVIDLLPDLRIEKAFESKYQSDSANILSVTKCKLYNIPIDFIYVKDLDKVFDEYDSDICKIGYFVIGDEENFLISPEFMDCEDTSVIKYNLSKLAAWQHKRVGERLLKLRTKFPDFKIEVV